MSSNTTLKTKMISISGIHLYLTQSLPFHKLPITIKKKKQALITRKILKRLSKSLKCLRLGFLTSVACLQT